MSRHDDHLAAVCGDLKGAAELLNDAARRMASAAATAPTVAFPLWALPKPRHEHGPDPRESGYEWTLHAACDFATQIGERGDEVLRWSEGIAAQLNRTQDVESKA